MSAFGIESIESTFSTLSQLCIYGWNYVKFSDLESILLTVECIMPHY